MSSVTLLNPTDVTEKCIFCKISDGRVRPGGEEEEELIFQNDDIVAFDDINPGAKTHFLIITKKQLKKCWSTTPQIMDQAANTILKDRIMEEEQTHMFLFVLLLIQFIMSIYT